MSLLALYGLTAALVFGGPPEPLPVRGALLLLDDGRILEGDIERAGSNYRIKRPLGESYIPARRAVGLGETKLDLYKVLRNRTDAKDPDALAKLATWCVTNALPEQAAFEAQAALTIFPGHREAGRLMKSLQPAPAKPAGELVLASATMPATIDVPALTECRPESLPMYRTKVQPLLMNLCASCHAGPTAGKFVLQRVFPDNPLAQRSTQLNLVATFQQLDRTRLENSPLLLMAVTAHGGAPQPAVRDRKSPSYRVLEEWASYATGVVPAPLPTIVSRPAELPPAPPVLTTMKPPAEPRPLPPLNALEQPAPLPVEKTFGAARAEVVKPVVKKPAAKTVDPTDPSNFNTPPPKP